MNGTGEFQVGRSGHLDPPSGHSHAHGGYDITMIGDGIFVVYGDATRTWEYYVSKERTGTSFGEWLKSPKPRDVRLGWGMFEDGAEVVYVYDPADDNFGYAVNLDWPDGSEWGTSSFGGSNE
jgi:hypothetical protein